jgi:hypothetical protein
VTRTDSAAERARRWPAVLEETVPHQLADRGPICDSLALAVSLLFDDAAPAPADPSKLLTLRRSGLPPVELDAADGAWRCTETGTTGRGTLELVAWARGCSMMAAACWFYALREAARRQRIAAERIAA